VVPDVETIAPAAKSGEKGSGAEGCDKEPAAAKEAAKQAKKKGKG